MKKKVITALLITMTLTLGGVGTVYAMNNTAVQKTEVNEIKDGYIWVVDKEAVYDTIHHDEEGHYETKTFPAYDEVVKHPEEGHYETQKVLVKDAYDEVVKHPEEGHYETQKVLVKDAWDEQVRNPDKDVYESHVICNGCGKDFGLTTDAWEKHAFEEMSNGNNACGGWHDDMVLVQEGYDTVHHDAIYEDKEVWVVDKAAWEETVHHDAVYEDKDVWVVDKEAWEETVHHPEETKDVWVVDKAAWDEQVLVSAEEGHWELVKDDTTTPEEPDKENPDDSKPDSENPDTYKPDDSNSDNKQETTEDTSKDKTDNKTDNKADNKTDSKKENTAPKTGDPTNLIYLATLTGSAMVGGVSWKLRKRK